MFCSQCGNKMLEKALFCGKCGVKVVVQPQTLHIQSPSADNQRILKVSSMGSTLPTTAQPSNFGNSVGYTLQASEPYNRLLSIVKRVLGVIVPLAVVIAIIVFYLGWANIQVVRDGHFDDFSDITVGVAFERFFTNTNWEQTRNARGETIVVFTGRGLWGNDFFGYENVSFRWEFHVNRSRQEFELIRVLVDGFPINQFQVNAALNLSFSEAGSRYTLPSLW